MLIIRLCMQLLQSLKSKMLDLARALQSYMHHHITVSIFFIYILKLVTVIYLHIYDITSMCVDQARVMSPCFLKS